ncbi:MAG: twin-arginine translocase subunit TatC [Planctomycetota bacterium]|nr:MAG: twin-arginine translocase subunit TatC [Planctomycetota bacterium]
MTGPKDLFDDTTMSFGEHLEVLRMHLWRALIGLVLCVVFALFIGNRVMAVIRRPIDAMLQQYDPTLIVDDTSGGESKSLWELLRETFRSEPRVPPPLRSDEIVVEIAVSDLIDALHEVRPDLFPQQEPPPADAGAKAKPSAAISPGGTDDRTAARAESRSDGSGSNAGDEGSPVAVEDAERRTVRLTLKAPEFKRWDLAYENTTKPVTLNVQEAFLMHLKVSMITGFILASPWIFYQIWQFVAAGLYPHERRYVKIYLPLSLLLFLGGAVFCFFCVFPFVLQFLLGFNAWLGVHPQIRLSEWISFALTMPVMFGVAFQLPLAMMFLERLSVFEVDDYRDKRRMAILVISILSMVLTPADPMSMLLMMFPLLALYELGILLCGLRPAAHSPFQGQEI